MSSSRRIAAFALIIAISGHDLVAPEPDALRLRDALLKFGIPKESIHILTGAQATRKAIITHLRAISTNPNIRKNTPILIYFAGKSRHGMKRRFSIPGMGNIDVECILPHDTIATRGQILPIPDITISALLGEIAKEKGNYITLLLDCCHSGSGSRDANSDNRGKLADDLHFDEEDVKNEDSDLWSEFIKECDEADMKQNSRSVSTSYPGSFRYQGIKSHVLIAACRDTEQSYEFAVAGKPPTALFTAALLEALNDCRRAGMTWDVTCVGLFSRIKDFMSDLGQGRFPQTPQCEGYNRERRVFATPAFPHRHHAIAPLTENPEGSGRYVLPVGELAGVLPGSEFEIYDYHKGEPRLKGRFRISGVDRQGSLTTIDCGRGFVLGPDAYAVLCALPSPLPIELSPDLHQVWSSPEFQTDLGKRINPGHQAQHFITPVRPGSASKLRVSRSTNGIKIEPTNGRSRPIVLRNSPIPHLSDTLAKAVMFYYHLERHLVPSGEPFVVQALGLIESAPNDPDYLGALVEDRRVPRITFRPDRETHINHSLEQWGLSIENRAREAYYIYIFYFDPNDFSIAPIYLPATDLPSVGPQGVLTIGYGNSGAAPLTFTVERHLDIDPGFFKIFYSIRPSEMSTIQQDGVDPDQPGNSRDGTRLQPSSPPFGSVSYPIAVLNPRLGGRR